MASSAADTTDGLFCTFSGINVGYTTDTPAWFGEVAITVPAYETNTLDRDVTPDDTLWFGYAYDSLAYDYGLHCPNDRLAIQTADGVHCEVIHIESNNT